MFQRRIIVDLRNTIISLCLIGGTACTTALVDSDNCPDCDVTGDANPGLANNNAPIDEQTPNTENPVRFIDAGDGDGFPIDESTGDSGLDEFMDEADSDQFVFQFEPEPVDPILDPIDDEEEFGAAEIFTGEDPFAASDLGLVDRWGYPVYDQTGTFTLLDMLVDGLSFGILPPAERYDPVTMSYLERQCIAQGEPEFLCRQRYGN